MLLVISAHSVIKNFPEQWFKTWQFSPEDLWELVKSSNILGLFQMDDQM